MPGCPWKSQCSSVREGSAFPPEGQPQLMSCLISFLHSSELPTSHPLTLGFHRSTNTNLTMKLRHSTQHGRPRPSSQRSSTSLVQEITTKVHIEEPTTVHSALRSCCCGCCDVPSCCMASFAFVSNSELIHRLMPLRDKDIPLLLVVLAGCDDRLPVLGFRSSPPRSSHLHPQIPAHTPHIPLYSATLSSSPIISDSPSRSRQTDTDTPSHSSITVLSARTYFLYPPPLPPGTVDPCSAPPRLCSSTNSLFRSKKSFFCWEATRSKLWMHSEKFGSCCKRFTFQMYKSIRK